MFRSGTAKKIFLKASERLERGVSRIFDIFAASAIMLDK
jgi:hypothetical protein